MEAGRWGNKMALLGAGLSGFGGGTLSKEKAPPSLPKGSTAPLRPLR